MVLDIQLRCGLCQSIRSCTSMVFAVSKFIFSFLSKTPSLETSSSCI